MTRDPHVGDELTDDALQDEIEMVGELVVAASASKGPLTNEEIDDVLGVKHGHPTRRERSRQAREWRTQDA
jgi:hypothetical protein